MKTRRILASIAATFMLVSAVILPASASTSDVEPGTMSALATRVGPSPRVTVTLGQGRSEWNSTFNWARAITETWKNARVEYLYAEATVTADGQDPETATKSSTSAKSVTTDKVYQTVTEGRQVSTYHTLRGIVIEGETTTENYEGTWDF